MCIRDRPFPAHNYIRVCDIDEGSSRLELDLTEQSLNRWGQPHGGVLFTDVYKRQQ